MNKIIQKMKEKGMTYSALGNLIGISQPAAWSICNGRRKMLNTPVVLKMCDVLGLNPGDFYDISIKETRE